MIFDPVFSYCYKLIILGKPIAELTLLPNLITTTVNAIASVIVSTAVYNALRPALKKAGLFPIVETSVNTNRFHVKKNAT